MSDFEEWWVDAVSRRIFRASSVYRGDFRLAFEAGRALGKKEERAAIITELASKYKEPDFSVRLFIRSKEEL
jgi:hypothetical protein